MATRNAYFDTLTTVSTRVDDILKDFWDRDEFGDNKRFFYEPFLKRKWGAQKLRSTLTYLSYCALTDTDPNSPIEDDLVKLCASTDLELWAEYAANWNFDNKGMVRIDADNRKKAAVSAKSFLEDAVRIVEEVGPQYSGYVLDASGHVTDGWRTEFILSFDNPVCLEWPMEQYMQTYFQDFAVPSVGEQLALCSDLASEYAGQKATRREEALREVFVVWGADLEVLNDLSDFCLDETSTDKLVSDQFSDIRNGVVTPPIWLMYNKSSPSEKEFLLSCQQDTCLSHDSKSTLVNLLFDTGTYDTIAHNLKGVGRKLQNRIAHIGFNNEGGSLLQIAASVFESNKFYHQLKEDYFELNNSQPRSRQPDQDYCVFTQQRYESLKSPC